MLNRKIPIFICKHLKFLKKHWNKTFIWTLSRDILENLRVRISYHGKKVPLAKVLKFYISLKHPKTAFPKGFRLQVPLSSNQFVLLLPKNVLLFPEWPFYFTRIALLFSIIDLLFCRSAFSFLDLPFCLPEVHFYFAEVSVNFSRISYCFPELLLSF